jgi:hypothetical protein
MMEDALRSRLLEDEAVKLMVGSRIDWGVRPDGGAYPCLVMKVMPSGRPQTYKGFVGLRQTRVQIDVLSDDRLEVIKLREAVITAIVPAGSYHGTKFQRAFIDSVQDLGAQTGTDYVHRDKIDALIWHN